MQRFKIVTIVLGLLFLGNSVYAASDVDRFKLAVEFLKAACVSGEQVSIEGDVDGGISFLKKGGKGSFKLSKTEVQGMVSTVNESIRAGENQQIRECMQPYVGQILNIIATSPGNEPRKDKSLFLPKNQWLPVEIPLQILDGKVSAMIERIEEDDMRRSKARIKIEVPRRSDYDRKMHNGGSFSFKYYDTTYKFTITNIDLHRQRAKITIIEM